MEPNISENNKSWIGSSMTDIYKGTSPWSFSVSPIVPKKYHHVLYEIPVNLQEPPIPHISQHPFHWDEDHVRMPYSTSNLFPVSENGVSVLKLRWKLIKNTLSKPINNIRELEIAINSYNKALPKFNALYNLFEDILDEYESSAFFEQILPEIIKLALQLPEILPGSLPLLKKHHTKSVSLSQLQVASLLANAFLCTFPWRKDMLSYPGVNFAPLFAAETSTSSEKLKCILYYFRRVTNNPPVGVVTFERKFIPRNNMPRWDSLENNIGNTKIHISSTGTIEDDGLGLLQVDFANKFVGGGVLGYGLVQEEIRFLICPELIVSRLFVEQLEDQEAVVITGAQRFSNYTGYSETFKWSGVYQDSTPFDDFGRRKTTIAVIDATHFGRNKDQFYPSAILRELNKAYVGFSSRESDNLAAVATGNWGCGAFKGDPKLKSLIQLMACCANNRDLVYYSFGDEELKEDFYNMYMFLANNRITIKQLFKFLGKFSAASVSQESLYSFIQQSFFDSKHQPSIKTFFGSSLNLKLKKSLSTSSFKQNDTDKVGKATEENLNLNTDTVIDIPEETKEKESDCEENSEDIIPATPPDANEKKIKPFAKKSKLTKDEIASKLPQNHAEIADLLGLIDSNANKSKETVAHESLLDEIDKLRENRANICTEKEQWEQMDVEENLNDPEFNPQNEVKPISPVKLQKRKNIITDYFSRAGNSN